MLKVGVHVSIAGKIYDSVGRAAGLGCNTMQIFSRNPRQWRKKEVSDSDAEIFKSECQKAKIKPVVVHIPYTLNLASHKKSFYKLTIKEFSRDLLEANKLGADYLVTHMGSCKERGEKSGLSLVAEALTEILNNNPETKTKILMENTSGSGSWLGYNFSHFNFILKKIKESKKIGICLDTAHAWGAGYKINEKEGLLRLVSEIKEQAGIDKLKLIHLNDTEVSLGSRLDRHCHIGKGNIGKKGFKLILNLPEFRDLPFILETPKKEKDDDKNNLAMVRRLFNSELQQEN